VGERQVVDTPGIILEIADGKAAAGLVTEKAALSSAKPGYFL
jgi:hypothetical protein